MTCLTNLIKLMLVGIVVLFVGAIAVAQMGGFGFFIGVVIGFAVIGKIFF